MSFQKEENVMAFWKNNNIYEKAKNIRKGKEPFYFLDGPPYASGSMHIGTAWNKILKDFYVRFWRMKDMDVWDRPGYDTHGLPIENKVEKEIGVNSKKDIEKYGIGKFINKCKNFATKYIEIMNDQSKDLGVWMDWENPYKTLDNEYIDGGWFIFKQAYEKGLLEKDVYPVHVCTHCETAVAYNEIKYKKIDDDSIFVKFPIKNKEDEFFVIWTTTPWTLPANTGIMANPEAEYVKIKTDKGTLIFAKELMESVSEKCELELPKDFDIIKGKDLEGIKYENPMAYAIDDKIENAYRVVLSKESVNLEDGTGLVHTAPGHGEDDFKVGKKEGLPVINPLGTDGKYKNGKYKGLEARKCNETIINYLKESGYCIGVNKINHDYPLCWRCDTHLLFMTVPQWFFRIKKIHKKLLEENEKINWKPSWVRKRFKNWLENIGDWPVSRQRYWGIPIPIWTCSKCDRIKVIGSSDDLPKKVEDLHRPFIDEIEFDCKCGEKMKRIKDVLDVWFDSGIASWASIGYPKKKDEFERLWPSDFQTEGPDQLRGWWNSQIIASVITFDRSPFNTILYHGFILDAHGIKISKSRGNKIDPFELIEKSGRDVLRYFLLSSAPWKDFYFNWDNLNEITKSFKVIENTFNFVNLYVKEVPKSIENMKPEDRWIISRLNSVIKSYNENMKNYNGHKAIKGVYDFIINDFSRFYIKCIRDRTWPTYTGEDKKAAFYTLFKVTEECLKLLAPACPFISEHVWQETIRPLTNVKESVHMEDIPNENESMIDEKLEKSFEIAQEITESAARVRHENNVKLRWPLRKIVIENSEVTEEAFEVLRKLCNVKEVQIGSPEPGLKRSTTEENSFVYVDVILDEGLKKDAMLREIIRKIQHMRKDLNLVIEDMISLTISKDVSEFSDVLKKNAGVGNIEIGNGSEELKFMEDIIKLSIDKI